MTHNFNTYNRSLLFILLTIVLFNFAACGGIRAASDSSADYKSARSLPPLKKPEQQSPVVLSDDIAPVESLLETANESDSIESSVDQQISSADESLANQKVQNLSLIATQVVEPRAGVSRLQIDADFSQAWEFLSNRLQRSEVTIFTRNKDAGRIAIGCGQIDSRNGATKSGGWSIFSRDRKTKFDYCAIQLDERRGVTTASLLDRQGEEIAGDFSANIFKRINNKQN